MGSPETVEEAYHLLGIPPGRVSQYCRDMASATATYQPRATERGVRHSLGVSAGAEAEGL